MTSVGRFGACLAHAIATFLAFPQLVLGRTLELGLLFAWFVPVTLLLVIQDLSPAKALRWGFFAGVIAQSALLHWIYVATVNHGGAVPLVGVSAVVLIACYGAVFCALFTGGAKLLFSWGWESPIALAALWVITDWLRSVVLTGFPWGTLGYALHGDLWFMPLVSYTGVYGLSFAAALGGVTIWYLWNRQFARSFIPLCALILFHLVGLVSLLVESQVEGHEVRVAVIQGNTEQSVKWDRASSEQIISNYRELTEQAVKRGANLIVWPETAVPGLPEADARLSEELSLIAREHDITLVVGAVGIDLPDSTLVSDMDQKPKFYDSAFIFGPEGRTLARYDKSHLVPFGEYVPLRDFVGKFIVSIASGVTRGDVSSGSGPQALQVPISGSGEHSVGIPICYELLFPDLVRRFSGDGAGLLLAITNDAWYGRTGAPYQFLAITALRAAESRLWVARAANSGVSALIDDQGRVLKRTEIFEQGILVEDVPIQSADAPRTFYVRHGNVFVLACGLFLVFIGTWNVSLRRLR